MPYHRARAKDYARMSGINLTTICVMAAWSLFAVWWIRPVWIVLAAWHGAQLGNSLRVRREERSKAWRAETDGVLAAMAESHGAFTPRDFFVSMADNPPPDMRRKKRRAEWVEWHRQMADKAEADGA